MSGSTRVTLGLCPAGFFPAVSTDGSVMAAHPGMLKLGDALGSVAASGNVDGAGRDGRIITGGEIGPVLGVVPAVDPVNQRSPGDLGSVTPSGFVAVSTVCVPASTVVVRVSAPSFPVPSATATAPVPLINMPPATTQATAVYRISDRSTMSSLHPRNVSAR